MLKSVVCHINNMILKSLKLFESFNCCWLCVLSMIPEMEHIDKSWITEGWISVKINGFKILITPHIFWNWHPENDIPGKYRYRIFRTRLFINNLIKAVGWVLLETCNVLPTWIPPPFLTLFLHNDSSYRIFYIS